MVRQVQATGGHHRRQRAASTGNMTETDENVQLAGQDWQADAEHGQGRAVLGRAQEEQALKQLLVRPPSGDDAATTSRAGGRVPKRQREGSRPRVGGWVFPQIRPRADRPCGSSTSSPCKCLRQTRLLHAGVCWAITWMRTDCASSSLDMPPLGGWPSDQRPTACS